MEYTPDNSDPKDALISAEENRNMFDRISDGYDRVNRFLSLGLDRGWRREATASLSPEPHKRYLDLGCGTGDMALEILRQTPEALVVGIDPSQGMLDMGAGKVAAAGLEDQILLKAGDARSLEFPDNHFDGSITAFCIRNVTERLRALTEIRSAVKPGGILVILELTEPPGPVMRPLFRIYSRLVMPLVTRIMSSAPAYRYLADSMAHFPDPETITSMMKEAGFTDVSFRPMTLGIVHLFVGHVPRT